MVSYEGEFQTPVLRWRTNFTPISPYILGKGPAISGWGQYVMRRVHKESVVERDSVCRRVEGRGGCAITPPQRQAGALGREE
jgi:hypothetical protein